MILVIVSVTTIAKTFGLLPNLLSMCFFFFQAEDGIRYSSVTGVQTCALPIFHVQGMQLFGWLKVPYLGYILNWTVVMLFSLGFAYLFYLLVERPSHQLARKVQVFAKGRAAISEKPAGALPSVVERGEFFSPQVPRPCPLAFTAQASASATILASSPKPRCGMP